MAPLREMSPLLASCPIFSNELLKYKGQVEGQGLSNLAGDKSFGRKYTHRLCGGLCSVWRSEKVSGASALIDCAAAFAQCGVSCPIFSNELLKYKGQVEGQGLSNLAGRLLYL